MVASMIKEYTGIRIYFGMGIDKSLISNYINLE